jgi:hypothetical protein
MRKLIHGSSSERTQLCSEFEASGQSTPNLIDFKMEKIYIFPIQGHSYPIRGQKEVLKEEN